MVKSILIYCVLTGFVQDPAEPCNLKKDDEGIKVSVCDEVDSNFKSIRSTFTIDATLSDLAYMMLNITDYPNWHYNNIETTILKKVGDLEYIYHAVIKAPWPVQNRDLVVNIKIEQDPKTRHMTMVAQSVPEFIPPKKGLVRIPMSKAEWWITPISKTHLDIKYKMQVDPGGALPAWLVNIAAAEGPFSTFSTLKKKIGGKRSKEVAVPIKD
ncbi:MAG: hypothetical protein HC811_04120 [Flammeovirgaceae bacterium]|nr:hypothetical protein [Flammeovirgaceae bacterium]